jgi:hypothetical protein
MLDRMEFFETPPRRDTEPEPEMVPPPWAGPPDDMLGGVVPIEKMLFQSDAIAIALASAVAFSEGVKLYVQIAARRTTEMDEESWWRRRDTVFGRGHHSIRPGAPLSAEVLRFGVRFHDGTKATTVDSRPHSREWPPPQPDGPVLTEAGGGGGGGSDRRLRVGWSLWLWPLPPAEPFEFAVEWPAWDVPLTFSTVDGAAIAAAAHRAQPYWP